MKNRSALLHEVINTLSLNCSSTTAKETLYKAEIYSRVAQKSLLYQKGMHQLVLVSVKNIKKNQLPIGIKLSFQMSQVLRLESSHDK